MITHSHVLILSLRTGRAQGIHRQAYWHAFTCTEIFICAYRESSRDPQASLSVSMAEMVSLRWITTWTSRSLICLRSQYTCQNRTDGSTAAQAPVCWCVLACSVWGRSKGTSTWTSMFLICIFACSVCVEGKSCQRGRLDCWYDLLVCSTCGERHAKAVFLTRHWTPCLCSSHAVMCTCTGISTICMHAYIGIVLMCACKRSILKCTYMERHEN